MLTVHSDIGVVEVALADGTQAWLGVNIGIGEASRAMLPFWALGTRDGNTIAFRPAPDQSIGITTAELLRRMKADGATADELGQVVSLSRQAVRAARRQVRSLPIDRDLRRGYLQGLGKFAAEIEAAARGIDGGRAVA